MKNKNFVILSKTRHLEEASTLGVKDLLDWCKKILYPFGDYLFQSVAHVQNDNSGFSLLELILAVALFTIFAIGIVVVALQGFNSNRLGNEFTIANQFATEGIEAARSIKNQSFANLVDTTGTGIVRNGSNVWAFSGTNNTLQKYTRTIAVADVQRDGSGNIVASGGTVDPNTKKITSTVNWNFNAARPENISLITYLTNWKKAIIGNWSNPSVQSTLDLSGNGNGIKIFVLGNFAYVVRSIGSPNFEIIDISNLASPTIVGSLNIVGTPSDIFVSGSYAYITSDANSQELQIINVTNPASPVATGSYDAAGNGSGNAIYVIGTTAYLCKSRQGNNPTFYTINVSNPASPVLFDSIVLSSDSNAVFVSGSYAYIASSNNSTELDIVNVSNPSSISITGTDNLPGNNNALSITGFSNTVIIGRVGGDVSAINVTTPSSPSVISTFNVGGDVNDMSLGNSDNYLFLATANNTAEFRVLDISNLSAMTSLGTLNMSAIQNGIYYSSSVDRAFLVGSANNAEFSILQPN